jgi:hypothetical protein
MAYYSSKFTYSYTYLYVCAFEGNCMTYEITYVSNGKFEILVVVKIHIVDYRVMTPCRLIGGNQCFGGKYYLRLQGRNEQS